MLYVHHLSWPTFNVSNITEKTEYPWKTSLIYRPKENFKFKFSEKPPTNTGGFFFDVKWGLFLTNYTSNPDFQTSILPYLLKQSPFFPGHSFFLNKETVFSPPPGGILARFNYFVNVSF